MPTATHPDWLATGQRVAVLASHKGQWTSIEVRTVASATARAIKFDTGPMEKLTGRINRQPGHISVDRDGVNKTYFVPPGSEFHRSALIELKAGDALRDANGALHVLKQYDSALAARSAADALEIAARRLREAATAIEKNEEA